MPDSAQPRLRVSEIFYSIQGESTASGERMSFVRLTGCPLRCSYCDTAYAFTGGRWMSIAEVSRKVAEHGTNAVLVTGGEPLAQKNTLELVRELREQGKRVFIETSGEADVEAYAGLARLVMDIKAPSSGEAAERCFANLRHLLPTDEIKFVLGNRADYAWAREVCRKYSLLARFTVLLSPVHGKLALSDLAAWMLQDRLDARLQTQLHKHIWGADARGV